MNIASLIKSIAVIFWIAFFLLVALVAYRAAKKNPLRHGGTWIVVALVGAFILTTLSSGLVFINPDERGVVISAVSPTGYRSEALTPGLRWIVPFAETVVRYPISRQTYTMSIAPKEGQIQGDDSITLPEPMTGRKSL